MQIEFRLETYLFKYYTKRWKVSTTMTRTNIPGMLALAQIKNRSFKRNIDIKKLREKVFFHTTHGVKFKNGIAGGQPRTVALHAFNANIKAIFYQDFCQYMDDRRNELSDIEIKDHARSFMYKYSLSDDEINESTLLKAYYRYRSNA
jgi:hypothetical protein